MKGKWRYTLVDASLVLIVVLVLEAKSRPLRGRRRGRVFFGCDHGLINHRKKPTRCRTPEGCTGAARTEKKNRRPFAGFSRRLLAGIMNYTDIETGII